MRIYKFICLFYSNLLLLDFRNAWHQAFLIVNMKIFLLFLVHTLYDHANTKSCRTNSPQDGRRWMSTKTGYRQIVKDLERETKLEVPNCSPVHLWTVVRHGTRYPSKKAIRLMRGDIPRLRDAILAAESGDLCDEDRKLLGDWNIDVDPEQAKHLHVEGDSEMILLGERWLSRLPELLAHYHEAGFTLRSTHTERSLRSGRGFITGLWTRVTLPRATWHVIKDEHDPLIRFYKLCDAWIADVKKNSEANIEREKFEQSEVMRAVETSVSSYLGVNVSLTELDMMYLMCNFETAWRPAVTSPWCRMFSDQELRMMEYREDLEYFWLDGPGHRINSEQACVLVRDMVDTFTGIAEGREDKHGSFYFTHSGTILKLLAFLKVFNDPEPLRSDNFHKMENRKWKTSDIGPFGANIAFVLQRCESDYLMALFVNEKLSKLPGCEEEWCPLSTFIQNNPQLKSCNFSNICRKNDSTVEYSVPDDKY